MGFIRNLIDWAADQVQTTTGEKERREQISTLKRLAQEFKNKVSDAVAVLNQIIQRFNQSIQKLNAIRNQQVKENIQTLYYFLQKFGQCRPAGEYTQEHEKLPAQFPVKEQEKIENYIGTVDWSQDEVFLNTFLLSPIGMKIKTREQNLSLREHIHELQLQTEETLNELKIRQFSTQKEAEICNLYMKNVSIISQTIQARILPELELVEAFFEATQLKDEIICNHALANIQFRYPIQSIVGTEYECHYRFVRNAFLFYIISCRVYDTPVLTNLLNNKVSDDDLACLKGENKLVTQQAEQLCESMLVKRGEITS